MGKPTGFIEFQRRNNCEHDPKERIKNFREFTDYIDDGQREIQGARCMDCGVPFCHSSYGCPISNLIPEWNDLLYRGKWKEAYRRLRATNNFPEITGRVCPAPCETACVLGINEPAVTIKANELAIIDRAITNRWLAPRIPPRRTGRTVAVIGSGPAGLAAADQLNQNGHQVTVFERNDRPGGLLMYGIPNMKLEKEILSERIGIMEEEGIKFTLGTCVGKDLSPKSLMSDFDAILIAAGSTIPRDLQVKGRELKGIHYAMEFLESSTRTLLDKTPGISAAGKHVLVIGGGDTGNDCIGTSLRQGCASVTNFEILPKPPTERNNTCPWPLYPRLYKQDYGHKEAEALFGKDPRDYSVSAVEFTGNPEGRVSGVLSQRVEWYRDEAGKFCFKAVPGSEETRKVDIVFLALGFLGPETELLREFGLETTPHGTISAGPRSYRTSIPNVYTAGDARRGQSLVVWAIREGREAAAEIDAAIK
ncbi:MAG: glutamate synthase subunit beta [Spirochaetia bacterium]